MVVHALHEITHELGVEERHRKLQELDEKVAHQRDVDTHRDMQQQPAADEVNSRTAERQRQLAEQDQPDEADILILDAYIHNGLREERQDELQKAAHDHSQHNLSEISLVFPDIAKEKPERTGILFFFTFSVPIQRKERRRCFKEHGNAFVITIAARTYPVTFKLIKIIFYQSFPWIGNIELSFILDLVENYEMVLIPVEDTRQRSLIQGLNVDPGTERMQSQRVGGFINAKQRHAFRCGKA